MENKLVMRKMMLARLMVLPTLMVITGLNLAKQKLPSVQLTEGSVLSSPHKEGSLSIMAAQDVNGGGCGKKGC
jgi:hypothetical protein